MAVRVPDLSRKLSLLQRYSSHRTPQALAEKLGISASTLRGYSSGTSKSSSDAIPAKRLPILVKLFEEALSQTLEPEEVAALVLGDIGALEEAFRVVRTVSLEDILAKEARRDRGQIHRSRPMSLVEYDQTEPDDCPEVKLGERFLLEFETERSGFLLALQNAQQAWWVLTFADGKVSPKRARGSILIPGIKDARFVYMQENVHAGRHRFFLFISATPFPVLIHRAAYLRKSLDWQMLGALAEHHDAQPRHLVEIHSIEINLVRP